MARIRTIKPEFFQHEGLYDAEVETGFPLRVAFAGLWTVADKAGRFEWRPRQIKLNVLPYDEVDFSRVLDALATRGFIVRYASQGRDYGAIPTFNEHQVLNNREKESRLPAPPEDIDNQDELTRARRVPDACPTPLANLQEEGEREGERKGKEKKDLSGERSKESSGALELVPPKGLDRTGFVAWWKLYPRKVGKKAAERNYLTILRKREATAEELQAGLHRSIAHWNAEGTETKFIIHPERWLSKGHWKDDLTTRKRASTYDIVKARALNGIDDDEGATGEVEHDDKASEKENSRRVQGRSGL